MKGGILAIVLILRPPLERNASPVLFEGRSGGLDGEAHPLRELVREFWTTPLSKAMLP
ncbi:MAG: hypothetical protein ACI8W8_003406 [Rhodothermales bacterium]